ncbi:MAG: HAMP domain-containing histidine kinase [Clostridia bacterium]|nr:HAMP domain-containing histidine kinase [Clostridia bacterium]
MKIRFVSMTTAISAILLVLFLAFMNLTNYFNLLSRANELLDVLELTGGDLSNPDFIESYVNNADSWISKETPYETRYFSVTLGDTPSADLENIEAVEQEEAISLANRAVKAKRSRGFLDFYGYAVSADRSTVYFVDMYKAERALYTFVRNSLLTAVGLFCAVVVIVILFSDRVARPIAESYERQKRFIADASHEMKTPLTIISANNEITEILYGESERTVAINKQVKRMNEMVKNLSALSRMDTSEVIRKPTVLCISDILKEETNSFLPTLESAGKTVSTEITDGIHILADEYLIRELFSILFDNARKYATSHVEIFLDVSKLRQARLVVRNDAAQLPVGDLSRFFERFCRNDAVRDQDIEGSGIGLSLAKEIVERFDGQITARGTVDGCFEIRILFPLRISFGDKEQETVDHP